MTNEKYEKLGRALSVFFSSNAKIQVNTEKLASEGDLKISIPSIAAPGVIRSMSFFDTEMKHFIANSTGEWLVRKNIEKITALCADKIKSNTVGDFNHVNFGMKYSSDRQRIVFAFHVSLLNTIGKGTGKGAKPSNPQPMGTSLGDRLSRFPGGN